MLLLSPTTSSPGILELDQVKNVMEAPSHIFQQKRAIIVSPMFTFSFVCVCLYMHAGFFFFLHNIMTCPSNQSPCSPYFHLSMFPMLQTLHFFNHLLSLLSMSYHCFVIVFVQFGPLVLPSVFGSTLSLGN